MRICLIHREHEDREVLVRALSFKLNADVTSFSSCERVLASSLDGYNVFVVCSNSQCKMSEVGVIRCIRSKKPDALIVGVSSALSRDWQMLPAGADTLVLRTRNGITKPISPVEITKLVDTIRQGVDKPVEDRR